VKRFDVCANAQLTDFAQGFTQYTLGLRILSDGSVLMAHWGDILHLDSSGNVIKTYDSPGLDTWFALNLDPDGTSFWSAGYSGGEVRKFDIASGNELLAFSTGVGTSGISVYGEITAATSPQITVTPPNFPGNPVNLTCPTKNIHITNSGPGDLVALVSPPKSRSPKERAEPEPARNAHVGTPGGT